MNIKHYIKKNNFWLCSGKSFVTKDLYLQHTSHFFILMEKMCWENIRKENHDSNMINKLPEENRDWQWQLKDV